MTDCALHIAHRVYVGGPRNGAVEHIDTLTGLVDFPLWTASLRFGGACDYYVRDPDIPPASFGRVTVPYFYAGR